MSLNISLRIEELKRLLKLQYPTINLITQKLRQLGVGAHVYKLDLVRACRQLQADPGDYDKLCLHWADHYFSDTCIPFGSWNRSMKCFRLRDLFRFIMSNQGYTIVNDPIGLENPDLSFSISF